MKSNYIKNIVRSLTILLMCVMPAGCSDKDSDEPIEGEDPVRELTAEQEAYTTLAGNFYQSSQPSEGRVLDEAKPSERSVIAETYEAALEDFERYLPSNEREERFINRTADGLSVDLGELGYVRFEVADGDGVVAKVTVALDEFPRYTIIYRTESSFGDNYSQRFSVGDLVRFTCPVVKMDGKVCNRQTEGVVIQTGTQLAIFTGHTHIYSESDYWKKVTYDYDLVSMQGWKVIYYAWKNNRELFLDTYNNTDDWNIEALRNIMEGQRAYQYVCVEGDGLYKCQTLYYARWTWYSQAYRLSIDDLRNGQFKAYLTYYAYRKGTKDIDSYRCSLIKVSESSVETIYPKY